MIRTSYVCPPIPWRNFDWEAFEDDYEPDRPVGRGPTEQAAIEDLEQQLAELDDE